MGVRNSKHEILNLKQTINDQNQKRGQLGFEHLNFHIVWDLVLGI
jgi:hypothetical protein